MADDKQKLVPIVGIGASAGGLEALGEFVRAIPENTGLAYVIIQHLSPDHPSLMDQLLSAHAAVPVVKIVDGQEVRPDIIYVLPAGPHATVQGSNLLLHERDENRGMRTPIDRFFESLAEARGRSAFAVILSGTGSDGTLGVRAIKQAGGVAIVQKSDSARFPGMPDSATSTGIVDFSLTPREIPARLAEIAHYGDKELTESDVEERRADIEKKLGEIVGILDDPDGHDFSQYKTGTLIRRIERRMTLLRERDVDRFVEHLRETPVERMRLLHDFLIGVTRFFRDEDVFSRLSETALEELLDRDQNGFRIWVPGCSTGEEAYSIAMLMSEVIDRRQDKRPWQIFGTDIDGAALNHARAGHYSEGQLQGVPAKLRRKYFSKSDGTYQIVSHIRDKCIFAPHNILEDPPFSRLDLVSCRNLLIYLTAAIQHSIIPRFHYALNQCGYLLLGPSETLGKQEKFFHVIDRDTRLFQRNDDHPSAFSSLSTDQNDPVRRERRLARRSGSMTLNPAIVEPTFEQQVLASFARQSSPPFAAINVHDEITYLSERMGAYIRPRQGAPSASIDQFLVRDLRLPVRTVIDDARRTGERAKMLNVLISDVGEPHIIDLEAVPLSVGDDTILVTLQPVRMLKSGEIASSAGSRDDAERDFIERELATTRQKLNMALTQYEATEQELKSSNEELLSMNEELQSSNEELETSREELQSINEELETLNAELTENNGLLLSNNSDLQNLFASTDIATIFLDTGLCVRRFTPASQKLFGVQDRDIGRPLPELKWKISYDHLQEDTSQVANDLQPIQREVRMEETGDTFLMRVKPYRGADNKIDGTVLTLIDISERKRYEQHLKENADILALQYAELETLYETTPVGLALLDRDLRYLRINQRLAETNGYSIEEHIGRTQDELLSEIDLKVRATQMRVLETGEPSLNNEVRGHTPVEPDMERIWCVDYYPVRAGDGTIFAIGCCVTEVTEQKRLQERLEKTLEDLSDSEGRLKFALETGQVGAWEYDLETETTTRTELHDRIFGYDSMLSDWSFDRFISYVVDADKDEVRSIFNNAVTNQSKYHFTCRIVRDDGTIRWIETHSRPRHTPEGELVGFAGTVTDITARKEAEQRQSLLLHELQHRVKNTLATTLAIIRFSAKRASSVENFTGTLTKRIQAIARTHDILTTQDWRGGMLSDIVNKELEPYAASRSERFALRGDDPKLSSAQMLALTLAFHELATNAAKYGALSVPNGKVVVDASIAADQTIALSWTEEGGPEVNEPDKSTTGFGSFLLRQVLGPDLEGTAEMKFEKTGVVWTASFPFDDEI